MESASFEGLGGVVKNLGDFLLALYNKDPLIARTAVVALILYPFFTRIIRLIEGRFKTVSYQDLVEQVEAEKKRRKDIASALETDGGSDE